MKGKKKTTKDDDLRGNLVLKNDITLKKVQGDQIHVKITSFQTSPCAFHYPCHVS